MIRRKPNTTERGYGSNHQRLRKRLAPSVERGEVTCWRCGKWIRPGTPWDLGHDDYDRSITRGAEHARCNRSTTGRKPQAPRRPQRWNSRQWW